MAKPKIFDTTELSVGDINFSPYNPRTISDDAFNKLKASLTAFGLVEPLVVNKVNMNVVGGNQRLKALKELGVKKVSAVVVSLAEDKEKALNVALNKIGGDWDFEKLKGLMSGLGDLDRQLTGFNAPEIDVLVGDVGFDFSGIDTSGGIGDNGTTPSQPDEQEGPGKVNKDGVSYVVYVSFEAKEEAEAWLAENGVEHQFTGNKRTFIWKK